MPTLPDFIPPMLAVRSKPFDDDDTFFEIKWDGIRCLSFIEATGLSLIHISEPTRPY